MPVIPALRRQKQEDLKFKGTWGGPVLRERTKEGKKERKKE
jgi:hypothetical protein